MDDSWIALFDRVASSYDEVVPFFATFGELTAAELPSQAAGARLLDVGAGAGAIALAARRRGYEVSAVDGSAAMVARLAESLPAARVAEAADLPFGDATFDVVTAGFVLQLLDDPRAALVEVHRVLKPGGLLVATVVGPPPAGFEPGDDSGSLFAEYARFLPPDESSDRARTFDAPADLVAAGFRDVSEGHLQVELPLDEPETLWRWYATHGTRRYFDALEEQHREEFHQRLVADLAARPAIVLRRAAILVTARACPPGPTVSAGRTDCERRPTNRERRPDRLRAPAGPTVSAGPTCCERRPDQP
jgi:SAM-dependent methyltransferase